MLEPVVEKIPKKLSLFKNDNQCENLLVFNSSFNSTKLNLNILKQLDRDTSFDIFEVELGEKDVDFILSPTDGLLLIDFQRSQQTNTAGELVIQDRILYNKLKYKNLHIIITCPSLDNSENLLFMQTCLSILDVEVHLCTNELENICQWIRKLCEVYGFVKYPEENFEETSPMVNFLLQCDVNLVSANYILRQVSLTDFITMSLNDRKEHFGSLLSSAQLEYHDAIFNTSWSFNP